MSDQSSHSNSHAKHEQGTMRSYVIGFILSLIFTFIPYFLIVNKTITGTVLMATILGFAVLQMIIQITFFLHLGRGPKPNWNLFFFVSTSGIILFIITASILIMNHLHYNMAPSDQAKKLVNEEGIYQIGGVETGACQNLYTNYQIVIKNGLANPSFTEASECDTLTFINEDKEDIEIRFGIYPEHGTYAGESEVIVKNGRNETITLSETGSYQFYNELTPETVGQFNVEP